ncbi:MAG: 3-dehydroquinate synthase [Thermoguttaceae bacterium]
MKTVLLNLGQRSYDICIAAESLGAVAEAVGGCHSRCFVLTETNVAACGYPQRVVNSLEAAGREVVLLTVPAGEESKSIAVATEIWESLLIHHADRKSILIAVGGGVVGDLGGFVAATFARGIDFFQVPTTLLAQVDSSVGGKVAINLAQSKNSVGAFYQPCGVAIDPQVLHTLSENDFASGVGEVAKYALALDASLYRFLNENATAFLARDSETLEEVIARCCQIKAEIVMQDERETGSRRVLLNYGHTFAHAFEVLSHYKIAHGHAVSIGMACAVRLAERLGIVDADMVRTHDDFLKCLALPRHVPQTMSQVMSPEAVVDAMRHDKKTEHDRLRLVVPTEIGACRLVEDVDSETIRSIL